jgi:hypothetical protein
MLDGMGGIIQFRSQWRKWTGYNTIVFSFPVRLSLSPVWRSIRWMELRQDQATGIWSIYQESTFAPDDYCRWMSSIAMDDEGNIALCYAKSGSSGNVPNVYPSLAFTGRLATDSLNTMTFAEEVVANGTSFINLTRFGDYAQTSLDPDGLTFWHTGEYVSLGKRTQIYAFRLTSTPVGVASPDIKPGLTAHYSGQNISIAATSLSSAKEHQVDLFDNQGKQLITVFKIPENNSIYVSLDATTLPRGVYFVRIGQANTNFQKVVRLLLN